VCDGSYWVYKRDVQVSLAAGIATGDENPNEETKDGVYSGFIGLQEIYSGKRVRSAFVLGGAGKLRRPLSAPEDPTQLGSPFAQTVNGFTNLVFCGGSVKWKPGHFKHAFMFMPNILAYWQEKPSKKFDALTNTQLDHPANTFLGIETNIFVDFYPVQALRMYFVASIFFPGTHYRDVRGLPLNAEQSAILDQLDETGFSSDRLPNLGDDLAYTLNLGIEFKF